MGKKSKFRLPLNLLIFTFLYGMMLLIFRDLLPAAIVYDDTIHLFLFKSTKISQLGKLLDPRFGFPWIRPVIWLLLWIETHLFGQTLVYYRLVSIFWLVLNSLLVISFTSQYLNLTRFQALFAGFFYLIHPASLKCVGQITQRIDLVFWTWMLIALHFHCSRVDNTRQRWKNFMGVSVFYTLALLSKETALVFPVIQIAWNFLEEKITGSRRNNIFWRRIFSFMSGTLTITGVYLVSRWALLEGTGGYTNSIPDLNPENLLSLLKTVFVVVPAQYLLPVYPVSFFGHSSFTVIAAVLFYLVMLFVFLIAVEDRAKLLFCLTLMIAPLLPVMTSICFAFHDNIQLRYYYPGAMGLALMIAIVFVKKDHGSLSRISMGLIGVVWLALTMFNTECYGETMNLKQSLIKQLMNYCDDLGNGSQLIVAGVPVMHNGIVIDTCGACVNITNFDLHDHCGYAPDYPVESGLSAQSWIQYLSDLPGTVTILGPDETLNDYRQVEDAVLLKFQQSDYSLLKVR